MDFSKINKLKNNDEMIFNLLFKYHIDIDNSIEFVKNYLNKHPQTYNTKGVKADKLFDKNNIDKVIKNLTENIDYVINTESVIDKNVLKTTLTTNKIDFMTAFNQFKKLRYNHNIIYITPYGIVKLMDKFKEYHSQDLDALYYNILLLCLYELDMTDSHELRIVH